MILFCLSCGNNHDDRDSGYIIELVNDRGETYRKYTCVSYHRYETSYRFFDLTTQKHIQTNCSLIISEKKH